ncbi:triosephosphate isomerase [Propionispira arboris]|uniref:Triosephosphate isomerase n=1 Tax=Propionispira arboris TaxID=84035 RepID=A0A1H6YLA8_9FIRM|nr:triose-phosphate isomerase [Propionispira arboris]SEJ37515.1 triosephosphate isomerase [Propionispira arboris]
MEEKIRTPFFMVNLKSYLYGKKSLELALEADKWAADKDFDVFFTASFADIRLIAEKTKNLIVTAQHMDALKAGRGMGYLVPEALKEAGAKAVFLNHAEHSLKLVDLVKTIGRAKEIGMYTVVCADSVKEAQAIALLDPDIILCEPTELIGTGNTSDQAYIKQTTDSIKKINPNILVMQAAGISTADDVYRTIMEGADGTGGTSGIVCAEDPKEMVKDMIEVIKKAKEDRGI